MTLDIDVEEEDEVKAVSVASVSVRWATALVSGVLWFLAGHGAVTNGHCGTFSRVKLCLNVDKHGQMGLDGKSYAGKIFRRIVHNSCNRPSCPRCHISWASKTARKVAFILGESAKKYGQVEHLSASVPVKDYDLSIEELRRKAQKVLNSRNVIGGSLIFHGFRYNRIKQWYWSPHFHTLAHLSNPYRCRYCERKSNCLKGCGGFDDVSWQKFQVDGWYVKVLDPRHERRNVRKTVAYELGHCSIPDGVRHHRVVTYFGVSSYRRLQISAEAWNRWKEERKDKCPLCRDELKNGKYMGIRELVTDRKSLFFKRDSIEDYLEGNFPAWAIDEERG